MSSKKGSGRAKKNAHSFQCNYVTKIYESIKCLFNVSVRAEKILHIRAKIIILVVFKILDLILSEMSRLGKVLFDSPELVVMYIYIKYIKYICLIYINIYISDNSILSGFFSPKVCA